MSVQEHRRGGVDGGSLVVEAAAPPAQNPGGVGVEVDAAPACPRLDWCLDGADRGDLSRADDRQARCGVVEVAPVESREFVATDAGVGDEVQRWVEALRLGQIKELAELGGGPNRTNRRSGRSPGWPGS